MVKKEVLEKEVIAEREERRRKVRREEKG